MIDFDKLNRETRDYNNNRPVNRNTGSYGTKEYWVNLCNNRTYRQNNGAYSKKYF